MKTTKQIFNERFGRYLPYFLLFVATLMAFWGVGRYFHWFHHTSDVLETICYLIIACASALAALMIYHHKKVMKKLQEIEKKLEKDS